MTVFVYGTLTDPERVASVLETTPAAAARLFVGHATLEGLQRVDGRYPTLVPGGSVDGRLLAVGDAALASLDRYEGVESGLYVRVAVPSVDADGDRRDGSSIASDRVTAADGDRRDGSSIASDRVTAADGDRRDGSSIASDRVTAADATTERSWVYVGDPARLAVDATWPGDGPFGDRVRRLVSRADVVVRNRE